MNIRELTDETRALVVNDSSLSPTREIVYTRMSDNQPFILNSYVGAGQFNKEEKDNISNMQSFGGLLLELHPKVSDTVLYDNNLYSVTRYTKLGSLYVVYCEQKRHNGNGRR